MTIFFRFTIVIITFLVAPTSFAAAFSDVPESHPSFEAIETLAELDLLSGYPDGTFSPDADISRAAATKLIVESKFSDEYINAISPSTPFVDIPLGEWYLPYAELARQQGAINGPPMAKNFFGDRRVTVSEFLKILFTIDRLNIHEFENELQPVAEDVIDPSAWYYKYIAIGIATTVISPDAEGKLYPGLQLTRAQASGLLYNYIQYKRLNRLDFSQNALKNNLQKSFLAHGANDATSALQYSFRAILLSNGLLKLNGSSAVYMSLQKITRATGKALNGDHGQKVQLLNDAKNLSRQIYDEYNSLVP